MAKTGQHRRGGSEGILYYDPAFKLSSRFLYGSTGWRTTLFPVCQRDGSLLVIQLLPIMRSTTFARQSESSTIIFRVVIVLSFSNGIRLVKSALIPLAILSLAIVVAAPEAARQPDPRPSAPPTRVVGYLASWGVRTKGAAIARLPAKNLTHVFYAFAAIASDGSVTFGDRCTDVGACGQAASLPARPLGNFAELQRLKERYHHLKLAISIGGWGGSARFSDAALTDSSRRRFSESAIELFVRHWPNLFDGIDIDW